ncbi:MAG: hypothetical protein OEY67_08705 [Gammaproteobacteria bacterium]|nr:hypothetical protein [Gammaproteobacteria bacterium]
MRELTLTGLDQLPKERTRIQHREHLRDAIILLFQNAKRKIALFSPRMDSFLFNNSLVHEALSHFVARHHRNQVHIIIEDKDQIFRNNERFIGICRRFSSSIRIRRTSPEHHGRLDMFILIDDLCLLNQVNIENPDSIIDCNDKIQLSELNRKFDAMWDRSEPISLSTPGL